MSQRTAHLVIYPVVLRAIQIEISQTIQSIISKYKDSQNNTMEL